MNQPSPEKFRASILIVDDSVNNLLLLELILSKKGYKVGVASRRQLELDKIRSKNNKLLTLSSTIKILALNFSGDG